LKRLLSVRKLEEQQCESELNSARVELHRRQRLLDNLHVRHRRARVLLGATIRSGGVEDRFSAQEELEVCDRLVPDLRMKVDVAEELLSQARAKLLSKRIDRRQVETLVEAAQMQVKQWDDRKNQQAFDEWFRSRPR
jgi:flagellar export protein FliJ